MLYLHSYPTRRSSDLARRRREGRPPRVDSAARRRVRWRPRRVRRARGQDGEAGDRKSTRLNVSHVKNSYAVFCLEMKKSDNFNTVESVQVISESPHSA